MKKLPANGFTLIEVMVAVTIFSVMLLIISSSFTSFVKTQRRQIGEQVLQEDLRLALEMFNKEARTAYGETYSAPSGSVTSFKNQNGQQVEYKLQANQFVRSEGAKTESLTDPSTIIDSVEFEVYPSVFGSTNDHQGYITIRLKAHAKEKQGTAVNIQSTVASRQLRQYTP